MITTIIFDIAKVLLRFDRDYVISCFYDGNEHELLKEKLFNGWEDMDEDLISTDDYEKKILSTLPDNLKNVASTILNNWEDTMSPPDKMVELVQKLKSKGYKLYVLSNMTRHFIKRDYKFPFLKLFDGIVYSAHIQAVKPKPEIYEYLFKQYSINPCECIFVDDRKENLATGARFGMKTFLFEDNVDALRDFIFSH